jgi:hypothetical protein
VAIPVIPLAVQLHMMGTIGTKIVPDTVCYVMLVVSAKLTNSVDANSPECYVRRIRDSLQDYYERQITRMEASRHPVIFNVSALHKLRTPVP